MIRAVGSVRVVDGDVVSGMNHEHYKQRLRETNDLNLRHVDFGSV